MTTTTTHTLESEIEHLVRKHVAATRAAAAAALERAFASAIAAPGAATPRRAAGGSAQAPTRGGWKRRPPTEVAGLSERLYDAVCAHPGETMALIASKLGQTPRALNRSMNNLKSAGRIRSAGQRQHTRYFPMSSSKKTQTTE